MSRDEITAVLIDEFGRIAPEADASRLDPNPVPNLGDARHPRGGALALTRQR